MGDLILKLKSLHYNIYFLLAKRKRLVDRLKAFYCILSFSALESLQKAVALQEEVLDTHEELILTHQAMSTVLKALGREEEAERQMQLARDSEKRLDSRDVPLETLEIREEQGWLVPDPVPTSKRQ